MDRERIETIREQQRLGSLSAYPGRLQRAVDDLLAALAEAEAENARMRKAVATLVDEILGTPEKIGEAERPGNDLSDAVYNAASAAVEMKRLFLRLLWARRRSLPVRAQVYIDGSWRYLWRSSDREAAS